MCGIAGLFHFGTGCGEVDSDALRRMCTVQAHRGPDGEGTWISPDRRIGFGHRRLAIVDPGPAAAQPMANENGTVRVTFNGEIYNHASLRSGLAERGHEFRTDHADAEVIAHAYEQWGTGCVDHFDGEFAFAIADAARRRLVLVRDRLGVKPLYFTLRPGLVIFASEIKALLSHPSVSPAVSSAALYHYLTFLAAPAPLTLFDGIFKLPAGCVLTVDDQGGMQASRYWDASPASGRPHEALDRLSPAAREDFWIEGIRSRLDASVAARMMADVPVGALLSGGLDSSANVAFMSRHASSPVRTFTVGYSDYTHANEFDRARRIASHFGTAHHEVRIRSGEALAYLPEMIEQQDEPLADWACIPLHFVAKLARDTGTPVVLTGEGSDELFCGYSHYARYLRMYRLGERFGVLPRVLQRSAAALAGAIARVTGRGGFHADAVGRAAAHRELFWGGVIGFWERDKARVTRRDRFRGQAIDLPPALGALLPPSFADADSFSVVASYRDDLARVLPNADAFTRMTYLECRLRLPELLLMRADKMTMATSVEARVPFLDHRLVEFTMGIPGSLKVKDGVPKYLLKGALRGTLPADVIQQPKAGFNAPMAEWLREDFGARVEATLRDSPMRAEGYFDGAEVARLIAMHRSGRDLSLPIWTVYNAVSWFDRWIAGLRRT